MNGLMKLFAGGAAVMAFALGGAAIAGAAGNDNGNGNRNGSSSTAQSPAQAPAQQGQGERPCPEDQQPLPGETAA